LYHFLSLQLIGPQFIWAIQPIIGDQWTSELEQAWSDLFKFIAHVMKAAMTFWKHLNIKNSITVKTKNIYLHHSQTALMNGINTEPDQEVFIWCTVAGTRICLNRRN